MHVILLTAIVVVSSLTAVTGSPRNVASWIVVALSTFGVFTTPAMTMRLAFVVVALIAPVMPLIWRISWSLTVQPLLYYFRHRFDAHRAIIALAPDDELYLATSPRLDEHINDAVALGFRRRGRVALAVARYTVVTELLDRDGGRHWVSITAAVASTPEPVMLDCSAELATGETVAANNYTKVNPRPPVPGFVTWRLPSLTRIADVVRACEGLAERRGAPVPVPFEKDLLTLVHSQTKKRLEAERQSGYYRYDASADVYRPTLKGAYRFYWVLLPPLTGFIDRRDRELERTLLAELGMTAGGAERAATKSILDQYRQEAPAIALLIAFALFGPEVPKLIRVIMRGWD